MLYGEHLIGHLLLFGTNGWPGSMSARLMGVSIQGKKVLLTRAEVERLRELCDEALA